MAGTGYILIYSNGNIYYTNEVNFVPTLRGEGSSAPKGTEAGTLIATIKFNTDCVSQKLTTLTGSGNSSASALAATGNTTRGGQSKEIT
jgi:hypothetical protein